MSKVKYRVREFVPKGQQSLGSHSWFAEVVINNDVDNAELAKKIAARTGFKSYECQAVVAAIADIVAGSIIVEQVFIVPGLGRLLLLSISNRDYPVVLSIIMIISALVIFVNFLADVAYPSAGHSGYTKCQHLDG